jgi:drug/metabolite transporter (DMT)-like permease
MMLGTAVLLVVVTGLASAAACREHGLSGPPRIAAIVANLIPYFVRMAEQRIPSNVAGVLNATTPLFTLGLALAVREEQKATPSRMLGLMLGFIGVVVILAPWRDAGLAQSLAGRLACLVASASYAVSYVYAKRYLAGRGLSPLVLAASQLTAASVLLAVTRAPVRHHTRDADPRRAVLAASSPSVLPEQAPPTSSTIASSKTRAPPPPPP